MTIDGRRPGPRQQGHHLPALARQGGLVAAALRLVPHLLPSQVALGMGLGFTFVPLSGLALVGVPEHDAGAASATLNATQQVGGSLGTALLNTMYTSAVTAYLVGRVPDPMTQVKALVHGYTVAFAWGAGLILLSGLATLLLIKVRREHLSTANALHMG